MTYQGELVIKTRRLTIRPIKLEDAADKAKYLNHPEMGRYTGNEIPYPYSLEDAENYLKERVNKNDGSYRFSILKKQQVIGSIGIFGISKRHKYAEIGFLIDKDYWGQGYATEATKAIVEFCFDKLKLHTIQAEAFEENKGSWKVLEKTGFTLVGIIPEHGLVDNKRMDGRLYSIKTSNL